MNTNYKYLALFLTLILVDLVTQQNTITTHIGIEAELTEINNPKSKNVEI